MADLMIYTLGRCCYARHFDYFRENTPFAISFERARFSDMMPHAMLFHAYTPPMPRASIVEYSPAYAVRYADDMPSSAEPSRRHGVTGAHMPRRARQ